MTQFRIVGYSEHFKVQFRRRFLFWWFWATVSEGWGDYGWDKEFVSEDAARKFIKECQIEEAAQAAQQVIYVGDIRNEE
jgi:hypothetical protein